jgi:hypothetical protein
MRMRRAALLACPLAIASKAAWDEYALDRANEMLPRYHAAYQRERAEGERLDKLYTQKKSRVVLIAAWETIVRGYGHKCNIEAAQEWIDMPRVARFVSWPPRLPAL